MRGNVEDLSDMQDKPHADKAEPEPEADSEIGDDTSTGSPSWSQEASEGSWPQEEDSREQEPLPMDLQSLRQATQQVLAHAANSGNLESAIKTVRMRQLDKTRAAVKDILTGASRSGGLEDALAEIRGRRVKNVDAGLEDTRMKVKEILSSALYDGRLEPLLKDAWRARPPMVDVEDCRKRMKQALGGSARDGTLESVVKEFKLNAVRKQAAEVLMRALKGGRLEEELKNIKQEEEVGAKFQDARLQVREVLSKAVADGRLWAAVSDVKQQGAVEKQRNAVTKVRQALTSAALDGRLAKELKNIQERTQEPAMLARLRQEAKDVLLQADSTGRLQQVLAEFRRPKAPAEPKTAEDAASRLKSLFSRTAMDGSLLAVMQKVKERREAEASAHANEASEVAKQAKTDLVKAVFDGRLHQALAKVKQEAEQEKQAPTSNDLFAVKAKARLALDTAFSPAAPEPGKAELAGLNDIRTEVRKKISRAALEGTLKQMLSNVQKPQDSTCDIRAVARESLATATFDGPLQQMMGNQPKKEVQPANIESMRVQAREALHRAAGEGKLKKVLEGLQRRQDEELDRTRATARSVLEKACFDGRLEATLRQFGQSAAPAVEPQEINADIRKLLTAAHEDGRLEAAMTEVKRQKSEKAPQDVAEHARNLLVAASCDGRLEAAIAEAQRKKESEDLRSAAQAALVRGALDGRLASAIKEVQEQKAAVAAGAAEEDSAKPDVSAMRLQLQEMFRNSARGGQLSEALQGARRKREVGPEQQLVEIKDKARVALEKAFAGMAAEQAKAGATAEAPQQDIVSEPRSALTTAVLDGRLAALRRKQQERAAGAKDKAEQLAPPAQDPPSPTNKVYEDGRVSRAGKRLTCHKGLEAALSPELIGFARAIRYEGEEAGKPRVQLIGPAPAPPSPKLSARSPTPRPGGTAKDADAKTEAGVSEHAPAAPASRRRRRIIGGVERAPKAAMCLDLTDDGDVEDSSTARESSLARGYDALGAQFHCMADKDDSTPTAARAPSSPASCRVGSRHSARHRAHLAMSSAMAMDLGEDFAGARGAEGGEPTSLAAFAMGLDLGGSNASGLRWNAGSRAATPKNRFRTSSSVGATRTSKHQSGAAIQFTVPQAYSTKATMLPALPGLRASGESVAWSQQISRSAPRWAGNQAIF